VAGLRIDRSFGIFSTKATVSMRGLSGKEQARVLVLIDGVPINKSDGGTVDWNMINPEIVQKIEITKGAASSLYGGNAMGGVINIITGKPQEKLSFSGSLEYGTYNTFAGKYSFAGKVNQKDINKGFYWVYNGIYRKSDGYISQSEQDRKLNPYIVKSNVKEFGNNLKIGYEINKNQSVDLSLNYYDDNRGTGETVFQPNGNVTEHDSYGGILRYKGDFNKISCSINSYYLRENYRKVNEYIKDDYTWYDVLSKRSDYGISSNVSFNYSKNQTITTGFDYRNGGVDAYDMYMTSTDIVYNKGNMAFYAAFLQDELNLFHDKMRIVAGVRYDLANYDNGSFYIENPTAESTFLNNLQQKEMNTEKWSAFSPKISVQYKFNQKIRFYTGYSKGFRASVLDDLCRTGRVKGGLKICNPLLKPEYLDSYESGFDYDAGKYFQLATSVYYSVGKDFMYYVSTGKIIDMGFGNRPIMIRDNISKVKIYGGEIEIKSELSKAIEIAANYSFSHSIISDYQKLAENDTIDLNGKYLTDVPSHSFSTHLTWNSKILNSSIIFNYTGKMWVNDANIYDEIVCSDTYPDYYTVDLKLSRTVYEKINLTLNIQNLLDKKFYDSKGAVCPGRFIMFGIHFKL
jgi:iron complex outermembrane receptor protein